MRLIVMLTTCLLSVQAAAQKKPVITSLENPSFLSPTRGYSHVAKIDMGNAWMLIISGQVPMDAEGSIIGPGNFEQQADFVYASLVKIVRYYGGTRDHIVRTGILVVDDKHISILRQVRSKYLNMDQPPTSTAMVVSKLFHPDFLVEIEATAVIPK